MAFERKQVLNASGKVLLLTINSTVAHTSRVAVAGVFSTEFWGGRIQLHMDRSSHTTSTGSLSLVSSCR
jgi:hypothetical protein